MGCPWVGVRSVLAVLEREVLVSCERLESVVGLVELKSQPLV